LGVFPGVIFCLCALASGSWTGFGLVGLCGLAMCLIAGWPAKNMTGKTQKGTASGRAKKTGGV